MRRRNVQFQRVGRTRVRHPRQLTANILGITATGTWKEWLVDLVGLTVLVVTWGSVLFICTGHPDPL